MIFGEISVVQINGETEIYGLLRVNHCSVARSVLVGIDIFWCGIISRVNIWQIVIYCCFYLVTVLCSRSNPTYICIGVNALKSFVLNLRDDTIMRAYW